MAAKVTLPQYELQAFISWLKLQGFTVEDTQGKIAYQVLRARRADLERPLIVYSRKNEKHYTFDDRDISFVEAFWASDVAVNVPIQDPELLDESFQNNDPMPWGL